LVVQDLAEGGALAVADVVDRADAWMIQGGCRTRFPPETLCGFVCQRPGGQELERGTSTEPSVLAQIDDAHTAGTDLGGDLVVSDDLAVHVQVPSLIEPARPEILRHLCDFMGMGPGDP
jgi:hypothetical protein